MDFNFKRPADPPTEPAPKKFKATAPSLPTSVDLNYPFWYTHDNGGDGGSGGGGGGQPSATPPLLKPNGPLVDENGELVLKTVYPIVSTQNGVGIVIDTSLKLTNTKQLSIRVADSGGLTITETGLAVDVKNEGGLDDDGGLSVKTDNTSIGLDAFGSIGVKLEPDGGLLESETGTGIKVNIDNETLIVDDVDHQLTVQLSLNGPITADMEGLDLDYDSETLCLVTSGARSAGHKALAVNKAIIPVPASDSAIVASGSGWNIGVNSSLETTTNQLGVKLVSGTPLAVSDQGLTFNIDETTLTVSEGKLKVIGGGGSGQIDIDPNTLKYTGNRLGVFLKPQGAIVSDQSGIRLLYDTDDFYESDAKGLTLYTPGKYLSPYCTMTYGRPQLSTYTDKVCASNGRIWYCSSYVFLANSSGMVNGNIMIRIDKNYIGSALGSGEAGPVKFTYVVNPSGNFNGSHSMVSTATYFPSVAETATFMVPSNDTNIVSFKQIRPFNDNWYNGNDSYGVEVMFQPTGAAMDWQQSSARYYSATVSTDPVPPQVLVFDFVVETYGDWFTTQGATIYTGCIPFTYQGSIPNYQRTG